MSGVDQQSLDNLMSRLRRSLSQRGTTGIVQLGKSFRIMDDDNSGSLDEQEFRKALRDVSCQCTDSEVAMIFSHFDSNGDGSLDYDEFLIALRGQMNDARKQVVRQAFDKLDSDGSGVIDMTDIRRFYNASRHKDVISGKKSEEQVLRDFLTVFEGNSKRKGDGVVTWEEWCLYYGAISASVDSDAAFNLIIWNAWNLKGENPNNKTPRGERIDSFNSASTSTRIFGVAPSTPSRPQTAEIPRQVSSPVAASSSRFASASCSAPGAAPSIAIAAPVSPSSAFSASSSSYSVGSPSSKPSSKAEKAKDKLRAALKRRGTRGIFSLSKVFRIMDDDNSGELSFSEWEKGMKEQRVPLDDEELRLLFYSLDSSGNGTISLDELIYGIRGPLNRARLALVDCAFAKLDKTNNGVVDIDDVRGTYDASNHPEVRKGKKTEDEILLEFLDTFESVDSKDGQVSKQEFITYYENISASIDRDDYFELMMNNAWHLNESGRGGQNNGRGGEIATPPMSKLSLQQPGSQTALPQAPAAASPRSPASARSSIQVTSNAPFGNSNNSTTPASATPGRFAARNVSSPAPFAVASQSSLVGGTASERRTVAQLLEKFKRALANRGSLASLSGLARVFKIADDDNTHCINFSEFRKALRDFGISRGESLLSDTDMETLFHFFDRDGSGTIQYDEMIIALRGELNQRRKAILQLAFNKLDVDNSGIVDFDEMKMKYRADRAPEVLQGKKTADEVLRAFMANFEVGGDVNSQITFDEFVNYYANVSSSIDSDEYFETMVRRAWELDGFDNRKATRLEL